MADYTVKRFDEMDTRLGGAFKLARHSLGASSFGLQVVDLPHGAGEHYPNHDHAHDGQEEVYVVIGGGGTMEIGDEQIALEPEMAVRVGPTTKRHLTPGENGLRLVIVGGVPEQPYTAPEFSKPRPPDA